MQRTAASKENKSNIKYHEVHHCCKYYSCSDSSCSDPFRRICVVESLDTPSRGGRQYTSTAGDVSQFLATLQKEQQLTTTATGLRKRLSGLLQDRRRESRKLLTNDASTALGPSTKAFVSNQKLAHAYVPDEYPVLPVVAIRHDAANKNPYVNSINNNNIIQCQQSLHAHKPGF